MLECLRGKVSDRKLRLFAVACCKGIPFGRLSDQQSKAVEIAEEYADGLATGQSLEDAHETFRDWSATSTYRCCAAWAATLGYALEAAMTVSHHSTHAARNITNYNSCSKITTHRNIQCLFIRDLSGNPFRPVSIPPAVLAWNNGTIPRLAQAIYDERAFDRVPILADALEEAGCTSADILAHCRSAGPHVRGCWAVDVVLGKE